MPFSTNHNERENTKAIDTRTGKSFSIYAGVDPKGRTRKIEVKTYGQIVGAYIRPTQKPNLLTATATRAATLPKGCLRRCHIVAGAHRYIGKETSRRWEQGDDMSMVD